MKHSRVNTILLVFLPPFIIAAAVRIIMFLNLLDSPLRYYSRINGLDMKTLLENGRFFYEGKTTFSIYKLITAFCFILNNKADFPEAVVAIQMLGGIISCLLVSYIALSITGKRVTAVISGCLLAIYSPILLYESIPLRESIFIFIMLSVFALLLFLRKKHFSGCRLFLLGMLAALPVLVRFSAAMLAVMLVLWAVFYVIRRHFIRNKYNFFNAEHLRASLSFIVKSVLFPTGGAFMILVLVTVMNGARTGNYQTIGVNWNYVFNVGMKYKAQNLNTTASNDNIVSKPASAEAKPSESVLLRAAASYLDKTASVFKAFELSNNVNYYFLRERISPLNYLLGPILLIPLALAGLIIWLIERKLFKKESLLFLYIFSLALPLIAFVPLARYRLALIPVFCISAAYVFIKIYEMLRKRTKPDHLKSAGILVLFLVVFSLTCPRFYRDAILHGQKPVPPLRVTDYTVYGMAFENMKGASIKDSIKFFIEAYKLDPASIRAVTSLSKRLMELGDFKNARAILHPAYQKHPDDYNIGMLYASSLMGTGGFPEAEKVLLSLSPPEKEGSKFYYYLNLGECFKLQRKTQAALEAYKKALEHPCNEKQKAYIIKVLNHLEKK